jgi:hypothetical protein
VHAHGSSIAGHNVATLHAKYSGPSWFTGRYRGPAAASFVRYLLVCPFTGRGQRTGASSLIRSVITSFFPSGIEIIVLHFN